jgi:hypothetical protein
MKEIASAQSITELDGAIGIQTKHRGPSSASGSFSPSLGEWSYL